MASLGRSPGTAPLTSADIPDNSITTAKIVAGTIATVDLADSSVTSAKIGVDVIVAEDIANNAVTVAELADNAVTTAKINAGAVTTAKIAADAVGTTELANDVAISTSGAITTTGAFTSIGIDDNSNALAMTIDSSENVGIGTATPTSLLMVNGTSTAASTTSSNAIVDIRGSSTAHLLMGVASTAPYGAWINTDSTTQPLVLMGAGGNVGIGTTSPTGATLHVIGTSGDDFSAIFDSGDGGAGSGILVQHGTDTGSGSGSFYYLHARHKNGSDVGYLREHNGTFAVHSPSDIRLKENIIDTTIEGLDSVNKIKVRDFDWKSSGNHFVGGFIANELIKAYPQAADGDPDAMYDAEPEILYAEGDDIPEDKNIGDVKVPAVPAMIKPMTFQITILIPLLVKAIQELSAKVTALESA